MANQGVKMNMLVKTKTLAFATAALLTATPLFAAEQLNIQVSMPTLNCGKGLLNPNECILGGTMKVRGSESINGSIRYYCDIRYTYVAAGSENQAIRFNGRAVHHGEITLVNGRAQKELIEKLTLKLTTHAKQIEVSDIGCERE
jgi:hypothetical protein